MPNSRLILGIDPGTALVGWGVVCQQGNKLSLRAVGCIKNTPQMPQSERLLRIYEQTTKILAEYKPDVAAVEKLFFTKNITTGMSVSQARGVILLTLIQSGIKLAEYGPEQVKLSVCGYGRADKKQVQTMVKRLLGLKEIVKPDDAADALATAICHAQSSILDRVKIKKKN
ncbi:Holliday junction helicase RuvC [Candidatus Termititenax persephonae]|uniref:Crossover junction endodeoxyribonuclease RuvC n=1 Tax=Candidatus Termititenax persephonae TaxID=2218525 RepID=A0A388TGK5_9BACT|nr:Holliday junction helicase RuvC [Candidatus Termititenax persephonae]